MRQLVYKVFIFDFKFRFTCGEWKLQQNFVKFSNIMNRILHLDLIANFPLRKLKNGKYCKLIISGCHINNLRLLNAFETITITLRVILTDFLVLEKVLRKAIFAIQKTFWLFNKGKIFLGKNFLYRKYMCYK